MEVMITINGVLYPYDSVYRNNFFGIKKVFGSLDIFLEEKKVIDFSTLTCNSSVMGRDIILLKK